MREIVSPVTELKNIDFEKNISVKKIIKDYKKNYAIDVSKFFIGLKKIELFKCKDTGYRFFYPFNVSGDSHFYEHFQKFDWYYMPWKWEHEVTLKYLKNKSSVLEVGCAKGAFIKKINELFSLSKTVGLELNETAKAKTEKWEILNETIEEFAKRNEQFDIVCSYQVLEHISSIKSFLQSKIDCLKIGGKLIISVPNNESFLKNIDNCLNMPPHHMGLWDEKSLKALTNYFPLKVEEVLFEPLQNYHIDQYVNSLYYSKYTSLTARKIIRKLHRIFGIYNKRIQKIEAEKEYLLGHSIMVVFEKIS